MINFPDSGQCPRCDHLENDSDESVGLYGPDYCLVPFRLYEAGDCSEQASLMFQQMLFALGGMNKCPYFQSKYEQRTGRNILQVEPQVAGGAVPVAYITPGEDY